MKIDQILENSSRIPAVVGKQRPEKNTLKSSNQVKTTLKKISNSNKSKISSNNADNDKVTPSQGFTNQSNMNVFDVWKEDGKRKRETFSFYDQSYKLFLFYFILFYFYL